MAKVDPSNGNKYALGGSKDTDLDGIDSKTYDVFTDEDKLANARRDYPAYDWFTSFTVKDKSGNPVENMPQYTIKFDKPDSGNLYYYLNGSAHQISYNDDEDKNNKKRVKATLTIGDPPIGMG